MHPNAELLNRLYTCLAHKDADGMAACYDPDATFHDIAFDLKGRDRIRAMWGLVHHAQGFKAAFKVIDADDEKGTAELVDQYVFGGTGRHVRNVIHSEFTFRNGLITGHRDTCDAFSWGVQALGPVKGALTYLVPALRRRTARKKLDSFIRKHPAQA
ncbi:nuclear transport factor 2 family protein [Longimicrobium sp.]|uniref:nuclear transport factor 2 family protein n=1 Tax=Longimicrobium sp. TaxID=2029185 RepID=UPI002B77CA32|nr:nuclear transport factor 2 family protein [Longimicrobium sp.]HSU15019.1 nuclear transport factor 2 family protein [Longimicrobium sp.]